MSRKSLTDRVRAVSATGVDVKASQAEYSSWAQTYDKDYEEAGVTYQFKAAECLSSHFSPEERADIRIIDVGAGTGAVAKYLIESGFRHIDALDPSEEMLNEARKYNLYENYFIEFLTKNPVPLPANRYDALTGSGIYGVAAHVPSEALFEMIRLVKPGGYIVLSTRYHLVTDGITYTDLEPLMDKLETEGKWKKISREVYPKCYFDLEGIVWCYQVL